jgi:hypothetical protein
MASINPNNHSTSHQRISLPVPTFSYPVLRWGLTACAGDVELAAHVLNSYLAILSLQIHYSPIEEDIPWQSFAQASAEWEYVVEQIYEQIPGLDQNSTKIRFQKTEQSLERP